MSKRNTKKKLIITKKQLINDIFCEIMASNDKDIRIPHKPDVIQLSPKSVKKIYRIIERVIMYYFKTLELHDDNAMIEIRPFNGVVLQRWHEPAETRINSFTGEKYTRSARKRFHAFIRRYWHRSWNHLDA